MNIKKIIEEYTKISNLKEYKIIELGFYDPLYKEAVFEGRNGFKIKMNMDHEIEPYPDKIIRFGIDFDEKVILYRLEWE